jgi:hypothetical protein
MTTEGPRPQWWWAQASVPIEVETTSVALFVLTGVTRPITSLLPHSVTKRAPRALTRPLGPVRWDPCHVFFELEGLPRRGIVWRWCRHGVAVGLKFVLSIHGSLVLWLHSKTKKDPNLLVGLPFACSFRLGSFSRSVATVAIFWLAQGKHDVMPLL